MDTHTIDPPKRPDTLANCSARADIPVEFSFNDQAPPGADEIALVLGILPDILGEVLAAPEAAQED